MTLSEELIWRGFHNQTTFKDITDLDKTKRTFYLGADPSAFSPQMGNLAAMMMAKTFIRHGFTPILLAGGATGRVGDPKDNEERDLKATSEVDANVANFKKIYQHIFQIENLLVVDNYDWFKDFTFLDFMRDVGKKFGMGQLLDREFVKARLGEGKVGVSFAEFGYGLIQGYDYLHLFREHNATLQLCGSDQWGNCVLGVDLIRKEESAEAHIWSMPLIINKTTGRKFGKSEGGTIWLDSSMTSPFRLYQFWLNVDDTDVADYIKIFTEITPEEFEKLISEFSANPGQRIAHKYLASAVTSIVHSKKTAEDVIKATEFLFSKMDEEPSDDTWKILEAELPITSKADLAEALVETNIVDSLSKARTLINRNAIKTFDFKNHQLIKKGKNTFA